MPQVEQQLKDFILVFDEKTSSKSNLTHPGRKRGEFDGDCFRSESKLTAQGVHFGWMTFFLGKATAKLQNTVADSK